MIIVCNSCSTQYSVNDAKVRGKLVRITCKHCATAIVVDGRQMSEASVVSQPLQSYPLRRRDESIIAHAPVPSVAPSRVPAHVPAKSPPPAAMREEDQTMIARSRFGDDMSVHDERTVIGQIPKEALEFERMFAQRTQPPPPDAPSAPAVASPAVARVPSSPNLPSFADEESEESNEQKTADAEGEHEDEREEGDDQTANIPVQPMSLSEPPTMGSKSSSDVRGLVSLAEATHPSVARSVTARRLRVTLITLLVLAVLVLLFVIQMPR